MAKPYLYLRPDTKKYVIVEGKKHKSTGCKEGQLEEAELALDLYIRQKNPSNQDPATVKLEDVINAYVRDRSPHVADPERLAVAAKPLLRFWTGKTILEVRGATCREYEQNRNAGTGTIRYELARLGTAIKHWHKEYGPLTAVPTVTLPKAPAPKEAYLNKSEAARLLAASLGYTFHADGSVTRNREHAYPALSRFIVLSLGTGTRHQATLRLGWQPNSKGGHIDFDTRNLYRKSESAAETKKRQTPVRLGKRLLSHLGRWKKIDARNRHRGTIIHVDGKSISRFRHQWDDAIKRAGIGHATPHILRHTRATWLMQAGVPIFEAAGALSMSPQTLERVYGHHHPDFQANAAEV